MRIDPGIVDLLVCMRLPKQCEVVCETMVMVELTCGEFGERRSGGMDGRAFVNVDIEIFVKV